MIEMEDDRPMSPESLALPGADGVPVVLGDGQVWLLHPGGLLNALDGLRDRIYDRVRLRGSIEREALVEAAVSLLIANYDLGLVDAARLASEADPDRLIPAVVEALFGPQEKARHRTYTSWAASALIANGIDPAAVPTKLLPEVLDHLVSSGRAIPQDRGIDADEAARKVAGIQAIIDRQAAGREAAANPPEPVVIISGPGAHPEPNP